MDLVVQVAVVEEVVVAGGHGKFIGEFLLLNRFTTFRNNDYAHGHTYLMLNWERKSSW